MAVILKVVVENPLSCAYHTAEWMNTLLSSHRLASFRGKHYISKRDVRAGNMVSGLVTGLRAAACNHNIPGRIFYARATASLLRPSRATEAGQTLSNRVGSRTPLARRFPTPAPTQQKSRGAS